ncbi:hypothetical protein D1872_247170 [compost metagenome]
MLYSLFFHKSGTLDLLIERVRFDLVDGGHDFIMHNEVHQTVGQEVADTDRLNLAFAVQVFHRTPSTVVIAERLVNKVQIEIVELQLLQGFGKRELGSLVAGILNP